VLSSLVYQSLFVDEKWVRELNRFAPMPDRTYFFDIDENSAKTRRELRAGEVERFDADETQKKVRTLYRTFVKDYAHEVVDASRSIEEVSQTFNQSVLRYLSHGC
jgi:thymidylate kinase